MISKLYIIGNGFDLHHCLNTMYSDFAVYLQKNHIGLYSILETYVSYPTSDGNLWSRFEENLANLDTEGILSEHSDLLPDFASEGFKPKDCYKFTDEMDQYLQALTCDLVSAFEEFIRQVQYSTNSFSRKIFIDKEASFLTFNYTNTLERLYSIDKSKIIYLHNSAFDGSENIILGHGIDPKTFEDSSLELPDDLEPEEYQEWYNKNEDYEYPYDDGRDKLMSYFTSTYKPTKEILKRHSYFFENLKTVNEIFVFGHSLSTVDLPYFKEIVKNTNNRVQWIVSFHCSNEYKCHLETLTDIGIPRENIRLIKLEDLQKHISQLKIDFEMDK